MLELGLQNVGDDVVAENIPYGSQEAEALKKPYNGEVEKGSGYRGISDTKPIEKGSTLYNEILKWFEYNINKTIEDSKKF
jgi:hypothetical protein